jgi:hypothetical protein
MFFTYKWFIFDPSLYLTQNTLGFNYISYVLGASAYLMENF